MERLAWPRKRAGPVRLLTGHAGVGSLGGPAATAERSDGMTTGQVTAGRVSPRLEPRSREIGLLG
ncbi:MAG TPA: hypothetical protein VGT00_04345 [Methylomirabilota bacterium]|nr:hypothetical protein [Methylomirabilota bacterium]